MLTPLLRPEEVITWDPSRRGKSCGRWVSTWHSPPSIPRWAGASWKAFGEAQGALGPAHHQPWPNPILGLLGHHPPHERPAWTRRTQLACWLLGFRTRTPWVPRLFLLSRLPLAYLFFSSQLKCHLHREPFPIPQTSFHSLLYTPKAAPQLSLLWWITYLCDWLLNVVSLTRLHASWGQGPH